MVDELESFLIAEPIAEIEYLDTFPPQTCPESTLLLYAIVENWEKIFYLK